VTDAASYYDKQAAAFFERTVDVDMSVLRQRFTDLLPAGAAILDAGCGSGRDARAFLEQGFRVTAFDASPAMVELARRHTSLPVLQLRFQDLQFRSTFEGIWACASLLHVPGAEEMHVLRKLVRALKPGGIVYVSYKLGQGERVEAGRLFRDHTCSSLAQVLGSLADVEMIECWETPDRRPGREDIWVNCLARKQADTGEMPSR
jgi:SAM-dependent methyltransferase